MNQVHDNLVHGCEEIDHDSTSFPHATDAQAERDREGDQT